MFLPTRWGERILSGKHLGADLGSTVTGTVNGDTYSYDVLGRVTKIARANGETRTYSYSGRATQFTDENGVSRISQVDGLGCLTIVCEIAPTSINTQNTGTPAACGTDIPGTGRAIAFELSWQANVSGCRKDPIKASFVKGHDFSRAAKRSQEEVGL